VSLRQEILDCLGAAGFETGTGPLSPLGQPLPLVTGWAVSDETATVAFVAESEEEWDTELWKELFFALASLRHELKLGRRSAFGTPITLAIVRDEQEERLLRTLAEELSRDYLLFTRVELNVLIEGKDLDVILELAPLLPRCRRAIREHELVGAEALSKLAGELRREILAAAENLDEVELRPLAASAAAEIAEDIARMVEVDPEVRPHARPIHRLELHDFRAFKDVSLDFAPFTLFEGANGTGKSSVMEALEIVWTGSSHRRPPGVGAKDFDLHLNRDGVASWGIAFAEKLEEEPTQIVETVADRSRLGVGRNVYSADSAVDVAGASPSERYAEFLRVVGLEVPELGVAAERLRQFAKQNLNALLEELGVEPVARVDSPAARQLRSKLGLISEPADEPWRVADEAVHAVERAAAEQSLAFRTPIDLGGQADPRVASLAALGSKLGNSLSTSDKYVRLARQVASDFESWAKQSDAYGIALDQLLTQGSAWDDRLTESPVVQNEGGPILPVSVTRPWLYAARALRQATEDLAGGREALDPEWQVRLDMFLARSRAALEATPFAELEEAQRRSRPVSRPRRAQSIDEALLGAAGFAGATLSELPESLLEAIAALRRAIGSLASAQRAVARSLETAPLVRLKGRENELQSAIARFELMRYLQEPLSRAQGRVLDSLFGDNLREVLAELVMALTRFEWYFRPPLVDVERRSVTVGGMATSSPDLDIRMLLNAGERSIVTLAWFLALHVLQPSADRATLVLDDPFAHLDSTNEAAAIATLRSLVRLTRPEMFVFGCRNQALADTVAEEFAEFEGWPKRRLRYRFSRAPDAAAIAEPVTDIDAVADLDAELSRIGLREASSSA
jgi:energy-coupling factor transporter ATP-binding protein EcfA2